MKFKRIDENTIRVRINNDELAERGLKVLDLLGNKDKIQDFFYSILSEVDTEHTFTKGVPVSFQVMPNTGGLDLLITKVNSDSQEDFRKMLMNDDFNDLSEEDSEEFRRSFFDLDPNDDPKTEIDPSNIEGQDAFANKEDEEDYWNFQDTHCYKFDDLSLATALADNLRSDNIASNLYLYKGQYFMKLVFVEGDFAELEPADAWAIANEFGIKIDNENMRTVENIGRLIIQRDALGTLRRYFASRVQ